MRIRFDKMDEFIRAPGGEFRHLVLFDHGLFDKICDKIKYLIIGKSGIIDSINHNCMLLSYTYHSESTLYSYLNVKELLA